MNKTFHQQFKMLQQQKSPIIGVVAGSGQLAKTAIEAGADLIMVLNVSVYRNLGVNTMACMMPFGNANDQTEDLLINHILPSVSNKTVVSGVFAHDPTQPVESRLEIVKQHGVEAVVNYPSVGFLYGNNREMLENDNIRISKELEMLQLAKSMGLATFGFVSTVKDTIDFTEAGVDSIVMRIGKTQEIEDITEKKNQIQIGITRIKKMLEGIKKTKKNPVCLVFGGAITRPEDFEELVKHANIHGYIGGSVFERTPVIAGVSSMIRRFKGAYFPGNLSAAQNEFNSIIGESQPMKELKRLIHRIAPHDVNTYIEGPSGSGKELVATRIHSMSHRNNENFVTTNCGAIPDTLIESEFFGYEKGAFTGAVQQRSGKFELANHGTLFLDEVADLSPHAQAALLRVIQQKEVVRVGGHKTIPLDVRILSASNQNLEQLIKQGLFRADLYFRLSEMVIPVPALNLRIDDIPLLIMENLSRLSIKLNKQLAGVSHHFLERLLMHSWPGNVRELEHVLTRAAILEDGIVLEGKSFHPDGSLPDLEPSLLLNHEKQQLNSITELRCQMAKKAVLGSQGNKSLAAKSLKISRPTLYSWLKKENKS